MWNTCRLPLNESGSHVGTRVEHPTTHPARHHFSSGTSTHRSVAPANRQAPNALGAPLTL